VRGVTRGEHGHDSDMQYLIHKQDSTWSIAHDSAAMYHLANATSNIQHEIHKNSVMLQEFLELDRILEHASEHALSVLTRLKGTSDSNRD
jgi:hypothetical protein